MTAGPPSRTSTLISEGRDGGTLDCGAGLEQEIKAIATNTRRRRKKNQENRTLRPARIMIVSGIRSQSKEIKSIRNYTTTWVTGRWNNRLSLSQLHGSLQDQQRHGAVNEEILRAH